MPAKKPVSEPPSFLATWSGPQGRTYYEACQAVQRATAAPGTFRDVSAPRVSVRDGFDRSDYNYFRPGEAIPTDDKEIELACMQAYDRFAIVRNVVDMMGDFVTKGIDVAHPSPRVQKFGQDWFKRVKGKSVSGRIASLLFRAGAAPVRRKTKILPDTTFDALRTGATAAVSGLAPNEVPMGYAVLNPATVEVVGGVLAPFVDPDSVQYAVRIPSALSARIRSPRTPSDRLFLQAVPPTVLEAALHGDRLVPLPPERTVVVHYKKDDFALWAKPMLYPLLDDLQMLEKLKQADRSALDGAIAHVRLWRLGSLEHRIPPDPNAMNRLAETLLHNTGGGVIDLIWGPELDLVETSTEIAKFLGSEKYVSTLASIYQGLGVPPTLTGTASDSGFTNNFVSLRVLMERLEYCRQVLAEFWEAELAILQKTFGFRQPFRLAFDIPVLSDDSAEKKLLIELVDRDLVSDEFLRERFGADPEIEEARIRRQHRKREEGALPPKAGPYHLDSQQKAHLERLFVQTGELTPSQVGLEYEDPEPGEVPPADKQAERKLTEVETKAPPKPGGRPKGAGDSVKRKQKRVTPKQSSSAEYLRAVLWADDALARIDGALKGPFLESRGKQNMRQVSAADADAFEELKFSVLCGVPFGAAVGEEAVRAALEELPPVPEFVAELYRATARMHEEQSGSEPPVEQCRRMRAMAYALYSLPEESEADSGVID